MIEKRFFKDYSVLEIERDSIYEYYLSNKKFGNLYFMYSTEERCYPTLTTVLEHIKIANTLAFWG